MAEHFAKVECKASGGKPVLVARRFAAFDPDTLVPDGDAADFPMTEVFGSTYDVLAMEWESSGQGWDDCLRIYRSVVCTEAVDITDDHVLSRGARVPDREPTEPEAAPAP